MKIWRPLGLLLLALSLPFVLAAPESAAAATPQPSPPKEPAPKAELVSSWTSDHMFLQGLLYSSDKPSRTIVIHIPGGPGSIFSPQDMGPLAQSLNHKGYNFLTFNMRSGGPSGMYFSRFEDYLKDVTAAVDLAKKRGMTDIILLSHSLGTARAVYYMSQTKDPAVRALVMSGVIASPYEEAQLRWNAAEKAKYETFLQAQRDAVKAGDGHRIVAYPWNGTRLYEMSSATWVNMFGNPEESNASTVKFAKDVKVPVLIVHGSKDTGALPANAPLVMAALVNAPSKQLVMVDGAEHLFVGFEAQYAKIVTDWLVKTAPPELIRHKG